MLEKLALEFEWRTLHGVVGDPETDPEQVIRVIMYHLGGVIKRYRSRFPEAVLMDLLRKSCSAYATGNRKIGLADVFMETVEAYGHHTDKGTQGASRRSERLSAKAFSGNSFGSYVRHDFTSVPEALSLDLRIPVPPENQTDAEISEAIDAILGIDSEGPEQNHDHDPD